MRPEYDCDYATAIRGKCYRRLLKEGANVVVLDPDVARSFRSSAAAVSALIMDRHMGELQSLPTGDDLSQVEGEIWTPLSTPPNSR